MHARLLDRADDRTATLQKTFFILLMNVIIIIIIIIMGTGLIAPKTIRSRERKFNVWNFRFLELSLARLHNEYGVKNI